MSQEIIEDLLVEWEFARQEGRAVSAENLCANHPELLSEISGRIEKLKSTSWMLDDATSADKVDDYRSKPLSSRLAGEIETHAGSDVTVANFVNDVTESGVLSRSDLARLQQDYLPKHRDPLAAGLALRLVQDGLLTDYQAAVLLKRKDGPLLLDRYVILDVVGSGGMGLVFKALHRSMERIVALKVLPPFATDSPDKIARFQREIKAAAKLSHPHIVAAHDAHEANGTCFLVMEYVDGLNLWQHVREHGPLAVEDAARITAQIASALTEAHRQGIIHRDIKPSNILLSPEGNAKLLDLGLARVQQLEQLEGNGPLTRDGLAMGTVAFMSPEQALDSKRADARSDVYSLGCTLYYLLAGRAPFDKETSVQTIVAHREEEAPSLRETRNDVPTSLDEAYRRMVAKNAEDRPESMEAVRAELLACGIVDENDVHSHPSPAAASPTRFRSRGRRRPWARWTIGLAIVGLAIVGLAAIGTMLFSHEDSQREVAQWVLRAGGMVEVDSEFGTQQFFENERLPKEDFQVIGVDLSLANVGTFKSLSTLTHLRWMAAVDVSIGRQEIEDLAQLKHLTDLQLSACSIRDEHLKPLAGMTQLESLDLSDNLITDEALKHLAPLTELTVLYINNTAVSDAGIAELVRMTSLADLDISGTQVTGRGIRHLRTLANLTDLDVQGMAISVEVAGHLAELQQLRFLVLDYCEISDEAIGRLQALPGLESLFLEGSDVNDDGLARIAMFGNLQQLDLRGTKVTAAGVGELSKLENLVELWLGDFILNDDSLEAIESIHTLEMLDLSGSNIDDEKLRKLVGLNRLTSLIVGDTKVTRAGADWFESQTPSCMVELESADFIFGVDGTPFGSRP